MFRSIDQRAAVFIIASLLTVVAAVVLTVIYNRRAPRAKRLFTAWQVFTAGVYFAVVLQYLPIVHTVNAVNGLWARRFTTVLLAFFEGLRVFILDGDVEQVNQGLANITNDTLRLVYTFAAFGTFIAAPILTAGSVLSFFRSVTARIRLVFARRRPMYVFSKLNPQSVVLARSVYNKEQQRRADGKKDKKTAAIVFTDVFYENTDEGYMLLCEAQEMNAICLKQDITHLQLGSTETVEMFVIGDDESENLEQTIRLTEKHKARPRTSIYVYANSVGSAHIIDALNKGDLQIPADTRKKLLDDFDGSINAYLKSGAEQSGIHFDGGFRVIRQDSVYSLVLSTFLKSDIFSLCDTQRKDKVISLLIVGMGEYGKQILKTALWFCQRDGYQLEINVVDSGRDKEGTKRDIEEVLRQECPEVITKTPSRADGEAHYDLHFYKNIDCFSAAFDNLFKNPIPKKRLERTLVAFVALGDDDRNIQASITLRTLFDRLHGVDDAACEQITKQERADIPQIYAVVYDDKKAENLNVDKGVVGDSCLVNYRRTPYHIRFIGNLSSHYAYSVLEDERKQEEKAFKEHIRWTDSTKTPEQRIQQVEDFFNFEYFKNSSVAKAVHQEALYGGTTVPDCDKAGEGGCNCEKCRRRKTEHMRWNAYMRVNGYCYSPNRADRALLHHDLRRWMELPKKTRMKD